MSNKNKDAPAPNAPKEQPVSPNAPDSDIGELDFERTPGLSNKDSWVSRAVVGPDAYEKDLLNDIYQLGHDNALSLHTAKTCKYPHALRLNLRNALRALKAMITVIKALDRHRHGLAQKISVHYGPSSPVGQDATLEDQRFAESDRMVDNYFLEGVELLKRFIERCRGEAAELRDTPPSQLLGMDCGRRFGPDRRLWEEEYMALASYLTGQVAKLRMAIDTRRNKHHQLIAVNYSGDVPSSKKKSVAVTSPANMNVAPLKPTQSFVIAKNVKKTSSGTLH